MFSIGPMEWILIIIALAVLLIWGPTKIPQLARGIGQAIYEFKRGIRGEEESKASQDTTSKSTAHEKLIEIARKLGVDTTNKTDEQLLAEIRKKVEEMSARQARQAQS